MLQRWMILLASLAPALPTYAQTASMLDPTTSQVATGSNHTCAVTAQGNVKCWGDNGRAQLGNGNLGMGGSSATAVDATLLGNGTVAAIAVGANHTCALKTDSGVMCWGGNDTGQLGNGNTSDTFTKIYVTGLSSGVAAITAGLRHTCALTVSGGVKCWGDNTYGQLGSGSVGNPVNSTAPVGVTGLPPNVVAIDAGDYHTCALTTDGAMKCWGANYFGQLGNGSSNPPSVATSVSVLSLGGTVASMTTGGSHTCALLTSGNVKCWGYNLYGQLGYDHAALTYSPLPIAVAGLPGNVTAIAAGASHTCALAAGGGVRCWGYNADGELGDGSTINRDAPSSASGLSSGIASIAPGGRHTCVLTTVGGLRCFGANSLGQLGNGSSGASSLTSVAVLDMTDRVTSIAAGGSHTCALTSAGGVRCWGENFYGQLGTGNPGDSHTPAPVYGLARGMASVVAGSQHTCALTTGGGVKCWGGNSNGQLGSSSSASLSFVPQDVTGLSSGVMGIAIGYYHSCALISGGSVRCWGANNFGQLGDGSTTTRNAPVAVTNLGGSAIAIAGGGYHTCALIAGGSVKCWGNNEGGQLGHGDLVNSYQPVNVTNLPIGATAIALGAFHTCAVASGGAYCWGSGYKGQLGNGGTTLSANPVAVTGLDTGMAAVTAGFYHSCALSTGGGAWCWGDNEQGALGNGGTTDSTVPIALAGSGVAAISAGAYHTCALMTGGGIACWGRGESGRIGNGDTMDVHAPVSILAGQILTFTLPTLLGSGTNLAATATSSGGGAVSFDSWTPTTCFVNGNTLTVLATGLCGVRASQAGGSDGSSGTLATASQQLRLVYVDVDVIFRNGFDR